MKRSPIIGNVVGAIPKTNQGGFFMTSVIETWMNFNNRVEVHFSGGAGILDDGMTIGCMKIMM